MKKLERNRNRNLHYYLIDCIYCIKINTNPTGFPCFHAQRRQKTEDVSKNRRQKNNPEFEIRCFLADFNLSMSIHKAPLSQGQSSKWSRLSGPLQLRPVLVAINWSCEIGYAVNCPLKPSHYPSIVQQLPLLLC